MNTDGTIRIRDVEVVEDLRPDIEAERARMYLAARVENETERVLRECLRRGAQLADLHLESVGTTFPLVSRIKRGEEVLVEIEGNISPDVKTWVLSTRWM